MKSSEATKPAATRLSSGPEPDCDIWFRRAEPDEAGQLFEMIEELALFEKLEPPDQAARGRLQRDIFGAAPRLEAYLLGCGAEIAGYALILETYSSFLALPTLYLEDLYVRPGWRGRGLAGAALQELARMAMERGCGRMEWVVLHWNDGARRLYTRIGAREMGDWVYCRLEGEPMRRLAGE